MSVILQRFSTTHIQKLTDKISALMFSNFSVTQNDINADSKGSSTTENSVQITKEILGAKEQGRLEQMAGFPN